MSDINKVLIIGGSGRVGNVVTHKCAEASDVFHDITIASRTTERALEIKEEVMSKYGVKINVEQVDAGDKKSLDELLSDVQPTLVLHVGLPYENLTIMDACIKAGAHYLDTANYEPKDKAEFSYVKQWKKDEAFKGKGLTAILGSGFDPGVTQSWLKHLTDKHFDTITDLDILDCNAGDHGYAFAPNFNPAVNIREVTQPVRYWKRGDGWITLPTILEEEATHVKFDYPVVGVYDSYLLYHEELESLSANFKEIDKIRFFMTFSQKYLHYLRNLKESGMTNIKPIKLENQLISPMDFLTRKVWNRKGVRDVAEYMRVLEDVGMTSTQPIDVGTNKISPLEFLEKVLPNSRAISRQYTGKTVIGALATGLKDGKEITKYIYNICDHEECGAEIKHSNAVAYTTGVPAMVGAMMVLTKQWNKPGVYTLEELNPEPFLNSLGRYGLPSHIQNRKELTLP